MKIKPKVLLVDEDSRFIESMERVLGHYDYNCTKASTGAESLALLQSDSFDIALLDIDLPDMSGCEIANFIQSSGIATTAIMLTGIKTVENAVQAMKMGVYDFLTKPLSNEVLVKTLKNGLEHNRLKTELKNSKRKFQTLAESAWEGIVVHENGNIVEANTPFFQMFGFAEEDLKAGLSLDYLFSEQVMSGAIGEHSDRVSRSRLMTGLRKNGEEIPVEVSYRSVSHNNKSFEILAVRDLTERVKAETESIALQKKLDEANKLKTIGIVAGSVAHDLNNILTGIVSYPEILLMQMGKSDKHYESLMKIWSSGKRAATLVSDLLTLARVRTHEKTAQDLNDLIKSYLSSQEYRDLLTTHQNTTLTTKLSSEQRIISCSPAHILKVLSNLVAHAFGAVPDNGSVSISTEKCLFTHPLLPGAENRAGDYTKLIVADNGPGIDKNDIEHIFNPFYSTKVMGKSGTGLELALVWNIVQDHNGWIEVMSNAPGTKFEVYLPAPEVK